MTLDNVAKTLKKYKYRNMGGYRKTWIYKVSFQPGNVVALKNLS